jgi:WD40 repeat protein
MATQSNDEKPFLKFRPRQIGSEDHDVEHLSFSKDGRWLAVVTTAGDWSAKEAWQTGLGEKQEFNPHYDYDGNYAFTYATSEKKNRGWTLYEGDGMEQRTENWIDVYPHFDGFVFTRSVSHYLISSNIRDKEDNRRNLFRDPYCISPDGRRIAVFLDGHDNIKIWDQDEHDRWCRDCGYPDPSFSPTGDFSQVDSLSGVHSLALSQDGKLLAATLATGHVVVWDISSKSRVFESAVSRGSSLSLCHVFAGL